MVPRTGPTGPRIGSRTSGMARGRALPQDPRHRRISRDGDLHAQPGGRARRVVFGHHHQVIPFLRHQGDRPPDRPGAAPPAPGRCGPAGAPGAISSLTMRARRFSPTISGPAAPAAPACRSPASRQASRSNRCCALRRPQGGGPLGGEHAHGLPVLPGAQGEIQADGRHSRGVQRLDRGPAGTIGPHGPAGGLAGERPLQDPGGGRQRPRPRSPARRRAPSGSGSHSPRGDRMPRGAQRRCRLPEHLLGIRRPQEAGPPTPAGDPGSSEGSPSAETPSSPEKAPVSPFPLPKVSRIAPSAPPSTRIPDVGGRHTAPSEIPPGDSGRCPLHSRRGSESAGKPTGIARASRDRHT
jgi:hypothetical protein